jgi:pimeloyl-ACP methyl ester carboxylesterase
MALIFTTAMGPRLLAVRSSDGVDLAVTGFGGDGPPVLLLHGLMGCAATWAPVARRLAAHGRVLALDARGHGRSGARGPWTVERMAADAAAVLDATGPAVVVGHSMGGLHGLALAAARPDLVRALVVEDMGVDFRGDDGTARAWFAALPRAYASRDALRTAFGVAWGDYMAACAQRCADGWQPRTRTEHALAIAGEWAERDFTPLLDAVRCPVLLVEADASVVPAGQMAAMARRLADARHVRLPGTGHLVHGTDPDGYHTAVDPFVLRHLAGR